jgi:hypothetical protein
MPQATMDPHGVITWILSRKDAGVANGAKFSQLVAESRLAINIVSPAGTFRSSDDAMDDATGHASYTDMQSSCVRAS